MKKLLQLLLIIPVFLFSCNGNKETNDKENNKNKQLKHFMPVNLVDYGYNLNIMVPDSTIGILEIQNNNTGAAEIKVGKNFAIEINIATSDMRLFKSDLENDMVYKYDIVSESPDFMIYKKTIPAGNIDRGYFFIYFVKIDNETYQVKNIDDPDYKFSKEAIDNMLKAAKTLESNNVKNINKENT